MSKKIRDPELLERREPSVPRWVDETTISDNSLDISDGGISDQEFELVDPECKNNPISDIWEPDAIWAALQVLPDFDKILELIKTDNKDAILREKNNKKTGLLLAAWLNNKSILKAILENKVDPNVADNCGRSALHLASYQAHQECISILLSYGAKIDLWDSTNVATPLHCASSRGCVACVKILIAAGADINAGISRKSPLHYAVLSNASDCVKELLEAGASPNTPQIFTETPLHVASAMGYSESVELLLKYGADVRVQYGVDKNTPLHLAAENENSNCTALLLNVGKAQVNVLNVKKQTPLHLAALSQSSENVELLLRHGADPNMGDKDGRTPLHGAIVKVSRSYDCVKLLLNGGAKVNKPDIFGYTPLHIAALNEFSSCVMLLIQYGGDVTLRTNGGISVLSFIIRKTPEVIPKYINKFDSSITLNEHEIGDVDCELRLDFKTLVPCFGKGETELLLNFIEVGQKNILKHPLCETFLFLKWKQIRKFFILSLVYHILYVVFYTIFIRGIYLQDCPPMLRKPCLVDNYVSIIGYILLFLNCISLIKEIYQIAHNWKTYIKHWENWLQWLVILSVFLCNGAPRPGSNITLKINSWQHHVAAIGIFFAWLELMMIVGRFPVFGIYIQMFTTIARNFSKFLLAYSCLLIAFALNFGVLFPDYKAFPDIKRSLLKVLIMMSGELEFEDLFYPDDPHPSWIKNDMPYAGTAHIFYLIFVLLVTIILNNLIVGLAVNDIQGLQMSAGLNRLVRQAELMAHLESMLFSPLLNCIPKKLITILHKQALLLSSYYNRELYIRPNDPRENRIPKDLIRNIYHLVAERKEKVQRGKSRKSKRSNNNRNSKRIDNSDKSINKSNIENISMYFCNNSNENLTNVKSQINALIDDIYKCNNIVEQKLTQIINNLNNINKK